MEEKSSLFSLSIDPLTKTHLSEAARWARFLAVVGFAAMVLVIFFGVYSSLIMSRLEESYRSSIGTGSGSVGMGVAVVYILLAIVTFFPLLYTFRFSTLMREALSNNDQALLNHSFQHLKICFRYLGIATILFLVVITLSLVLGVAGLAVN